ncbi:SRS domain-containing protein [Neospora caninum Liverpool]|uniref:SRS domain-containing protein n=1 Tax=Neospora caninum (strain Liverpool) TaxID=572307 RepID=F0VLA3_NEOCL|nr:SRS domain-containing protein [Neospora caninum Liverpool]CBZ54855.1 SRS domain-containing protein [Neospora caninum Liverpool]CEL69575.1 TPA: SRS domain-containing protein [Neospora caninum Liverpool]|eukprot:XP_003884883.1 SRS domain-containing protein [Neospora caninum Liverpool]
MSNKASGGFQALRGLRYAVGIVLVGVLCLSKVGAAATDDSILAVCGRDDAVLVQLPLKDTKTTAKFKCPEGSVLFPGEPGEAGGQLTKFCEDSSCTRQATLGDSFRLSAEVENGRKKTQESKTYTLQMTRELESSKNLYFLCKATKAQSEDTGSGGAKTATETTDTTCTVLVAAFGSKPASDKESESEQDTNLECTIGRTVPVTTLTSTSNKVSFRCGDIGDLLPGNIENAFNGEECSKEESLTQLGLGATLVVGRSASENSAVAYTLEVSKFPTDAPVSLCYKCNIDSTDGKQAQQKSGTE